MLRRDVKTNENLRTSQNVRTCVFGRNPRISERPSERAPSRKRLGHGTRSVAICDQQCVGVGVVDVGRYE
jgi:hypothetical protein